MSLKPETLEALERFRKERFTVHTFDTPEEMEEFLVSAVPEGTSAGFGGSMTLCRDLRVYERLRGMGREVWYHGAKNDISPAEVMANAARADVYMLSANAVSADGAILNIDGRGNRLGAVLCGPKEIYFAVSESKFCPDRQAAMARAKSVACVENARRLGCKTPCALTGQCADCKSPDRICTFTLWTDWVPANRVFHLCVCPGKLGF